MAANSSFPQHIFMAFWVAFRIIIIIIIIIIIKGIYIAQVRKGHKCAKGHKM